ncbi:MAG: ABC transporter ATP-binding protein [Candidatus Yanofskybacteria bacterium]|nr:ABC transporter ATP-binding protein [Candidatus Yanofskybacteria bacterium]
MYNLTLGTFKTKGGTTVLAFLRRTLEVYRTFRGPATVVFALLVAGQLVSMARPYLFGVIGDGLIAAHADSPWATMAATLPFVGLILATSLVSNALWGLRQHIEVAHLDFEVGQLTARRTLERLMEFSPGQHMAENSGLKQSVVNKGQHSLSTMAYTVIYEVAPLVLEIFILLAGLLWMSWRVGAVVVSGIAVYLIATYLINRPFVPQLKRLEKMWHDDSRLYGEVMRNISLVQINAQEKRIVAETQESVARVNAFAKGIWLSYLLKNAAKNGVIIGATTAAVVATAAYAVATGAATPGQFITLVWWSLSPIGRIENFGAIQRRIMTMRAAIERYWDMLAIEPDVKEAPQPIWPPALRGKIEFADVSFAYPARKARPTDTEHEDDSAAIGDHVESISGVSFTVNPGERAAIVGPSGAGKSTLVKLILRAFDVTGGVIRIDGYDIRALALKRLRRSIGLVEQDITLFDNTLRYNITFGLDRAARETVTDAELDRIARLCCVDEFKDRLEHGYDTVIGERGIQLSGGQRQRVGIARAVIKNPAILILDEATSSLDAENEDRFRRALDEVSKNRTTIIVAHRFSTIRGADRILVMDEGRLVDHGTHEELANRCPVYQRLLHNQIDGVLQ